MNAPDTCPHCGASNGEHKTHSRYRCMAGTFSLSDAAPEEPTRTNLIGTGDVRYAKGTLDR